MYETGVGVVIMEELFVYAILLYEELVTESAYSKRLNELLNNNHYSEKRDVLKKFPQVFNSWKEIFMFYFLFLPF